MAEIELLVFEGKKYQKVQELAEAMGLNWNAGKRILFRGELSEHVRASNPKVYKCCNDALQKVSRGNANEDLIFLEVLYTIAPEMEAIYWRGSKFASPSALGRAMLDALWQENESQYKLYDNILSERVLSTYVLVRDSENDRLIQTVKSLEALWKTTKESKGDLKRVYYLMAYLLSNQKIMKVGDEEIRTLDEFTDYLQRKLQISIKTFVETTHLFIDTDGNLNVQFEAWLTALEKKETINQWRDVLQSPPNELNKIGSFTDCMHRRVCSRVLSLLRGLKIQFCFCLSSC